MRHWLAPGLAVATVALLAATPGHLRLGAQPVQAAQTWAVTVGTDIEAENIELNSYFPNVLTVNVGDTVNWTFAGFHTVTFNAGQPPLPLIGPGPNPGELQLGAGYFPYPPGPNPPSGNYDGSTQISSGTPPNGPGPSDQAPPPFTLSFTKAGTFTYECMIHPGMHGTVVVTPSGGALPEAPDQATARGGNEAMMLEDTIRQEAASVQAGHGTSPSGTGVVTSAAGVSDPGGVSKLAFLPGDLTVHVGDVVVWTLADPFEAHTVTFTGGAPPPDFATPAGPPTNGPPTLVIRANVAGPVGGSTYSGQGYANSGILFPGQSYALSFSTPGTYQYLCLIHPFMMGTVTVTQ